MIEAKDFEVDGKSYRLTMFGAKAGQKLLTRVVKVLGPAFGHGAGDGATLNIGKAVEAFCDEVDAALFAEIADGFARKCEVSDDGATYRPLAAEYDDHFAGRYLSLLRWVGKCFEVNYADFFAEWEKVADLLPFRKAATAMPSGSPGTSTGTFIGSRAAGSTPTG